ncbi:MAG: hypothetical protein B7733_07780 [Myxococcales bacterium FL481]|nr:MAG: hypothetical protein B7733_07780 [Myxococcales bacterium FL481]
MTTIMTLREQVCLSVLLAAAGCKKDEATVAPDPTAAVGSSDEVAAPAPPVEQEPDPPELASLREQYLRGEYRLVEQQAAPLARDWNQPTQVRASSLAGSWHALAAVESMPDAAKPAVDEALRKATELGDPAASQLALIAHGVYLMRIGEPAQAQADLDRAVELAALAQHTELASLFRAESMLNQAYGPDERLNDPKQLAAARQAYHGIVGGAGQPMLKARALEGLAAISKELGDKAELCRLTQEASAAYEANAAAEFLRQGPELLATDAGCNEK